MPGLPEDVAARAREAFGRAIREQRRSRGMRQVDLAEEVGVATTYVSHLESGQRNPSLTTQLSLALALEVPLCDLVDAAEQAVGLPEGLDGDADIA